MDAGDGGAAGSVALAMLAEKTRENRGARSKSRTISSRLGIEPPPRAAKLNEVSKPEIAGGTPRENPVDETPCKKARGREAAIDRTKAAATIKGGREAEALEEEADDAGIDDDEVASGGRRRPTIPTTIANVANVDDNEATSGGRCHPIKAPPAIASGGRLRPTIVVETFDKDGVTGEEFSLASEDDFATKDDDDDEEEDPEKRTAVPRVRQRATEAPPPNEAEALLGALARLASDERTRNPLRTSGRRRPFQQGGRLRSQLAGH
jgi:hypothetical protein